MPRHYWLQLTKADNSPFGKPEAVTEWLRTEASNAVLSVSEVPRCCFCWRGLVNGFAGSHLASECGWLKSFNRTRENRRLTPITVIEGSIAIAGTTRQLTVEGLAREFNTEKKEVRGQLGKLDQRVTVLEPKAKRKQSGDTSGPASSSTSQPKKQKTKAAAATASGAKSTTATEIQSPQVQAERAGKKAKAKGKKGKGQGKATQST